MTKEKQIEEMRKDLIEIFDEEYNKRRLITPDFTAIHLAAKGYRKADDVAREIFEEIEEILDRHSISYLKVGEICGEHYYDGVMQFDIFELKKKYTESEGTE